MFKKYKVCDCFLEVACHCLHTNSDFESFQKMCEEKFEKDNSSSDNHIFCILKAEHYVTRATYVACRGNFVSFQIDLFKVTDSFPLATVDCNYAERRCDDNIDYGVSFDYAEDLPIDDDGSDSSSSDDDEQTFKRAPALNSSVCYAEMRLGSLCFTRFCFPCQEIFLLYFTNQLHIITNNVFC